MWAWRAPMGRWGRLRVQVWVELMLWSLGSWTLMGVAVGVGSRCGVLQRI